MCLLDNTALEAMYGLRRKKRGLQLPGRGHIHSTFERRQEAGNRIETPTHSFSAVGSKYVTKDPQRRNTKPTSLFYCKELRSRRENPAILLLPPSCNPASAPLSVRRRSGFVIHVSLKLHKCRRFNGGWSASLLRRKESQGSPSYRIA